MYSHVKMLQTDLAWLQTLHRKARFGGPDFVIEVAISHVSRQGSAAEHSGHVGQTQRVEVRDVLTSMLSKRE